MGLSACAAESNDKVPRIGDHMMVMCGHMLYEGWVVCQLESGPCQHIRGMHDFKIWVAEWW